MTLTHTTNNKKYPRCDIAERNSRPVASGVRGEPRARQRAPPPRLAAAPRRLCRDAPPDTLPAGSTNMIINQSNFTATTSILLQLTYTYVRSFFCMLETR